MRLELKPDLSQRLLHPIFRIPHARNTIAAFLLSLSFFTNFYAQTLNLRRDAKVFIIRPLDELTIFMEKKGVRNDSIEMMIRGKLLNIKYDSLYMAYDEYAKHNYFHQANDSLHYIDEVLHDTVLFMKVPVNDITGIYWHRTKLKTAMTRVVFVTLGISLVTMPFVLALKPGPAQETLATLNILSAGAMLSAATVGIVWSRKKFWISPKNNKSWNVVP